jgi:hypothetical protein
MKTIILFLNLLLLAGFSYWQWKRTSTLRLFFWPALLFKLGCGMALGLIYLFYYKSGDTLTYFSDGVILADIARNDLPEYFRILVSAYGDPGWPALQMQEEPRAIILVKAVSFANVLSFNNYWISSLYFSMISFLGSWYLVHCLHRHFFRTTPAAMVAFLFLPSVVFWSAGLIKESLAMGSLFFLTGIFLQIWFREKVRWTTWVIVPMAVWLLWNLKYYFAAIFFLVIMTNLLFRFVSNRFKIEGHVKETVIWLLLLLVPLVFISQLHPNFYPHRFLNVIVENYQAFLRLTAPEDLIGFHDLEPRASSLLLNAPWALISGLFRPFLWEAGNALQSIASVENFLLLFLSFTGLYHFRSAMASSHRILIISVLVYIIVLCILITLSTPNFGTLSRYRVSYIPFLFFLLCCSQPVLTILQRSLNRLVRIKP